MNVALLIAAHLCAPLLASQVELEPAVVKLERRGSTELWTVKARESSVRALLERVGELSGRTIEATTAIERAPLVTIELERRPLEQVLEFALGSAGLLVDLDGQSVRVRADRASEETLDQRASLAAAAWARAAASHPRHPVAPSARLAQGELDELRGHTADARARYLEVLTSAPASSSAGEAYLRAGRIAAARGDQREASEHFRALANLPGAEEYQALARTELARATLRLGDAQSALHILDSLELSHPSWEKSERTARLLTRIETLLALERFQDALLLLESLGASLDPLGAREVPMLRARALEGSGLADEAARAWIQAARELGEPARSAAYRSAVRLAEASGDPLAVLFVAREARAAGCAAAVGEAESRARNTLGMDGPSDITPRALQRLEQAERWLERRELERAGDELEPLFAERASLDLDPRARVRLTLAWARCVLDAQGVESAARLARVERDALAANEARAQLDQGMAALFEQAGLFERAADAYRGDY